MADYIALRALQVFIVLLTVGVVIDMIINGVY